MRYYSSRRFQDGVDHIVNLSGGTTYGDWTFGLSQGYASTSQPLIDTASQLDQEVYSTSLNAQDRLGGQFTLDMSLNQSLRVREPGPA